MIPLPEEVTMASVTSALEKLEAAGIVKRTNGGIYVLPTSTLREVYSRVRDLTDLYGELRGVDALVLGTVPPFLETRPATLAQIVGVVRLARSVAADAEERRYHGV